MTYPFKPMRPRKKGSVPLLRSEAVERAEAAIRQERAEMRRFYRDVSLLIAGKYVVMAAAFFAVLEIMKGCS